MYWVLQNNIYKEKGYDELIQNLTHARIPYSLHKVIPFVGQLEPDIFPKNPVICIGTYSMRHVARKKQWYPGVFDLKMFPHMVCQLNWQKHMLNYDAQYFYFSEAKWQGAEDFFIRPNDDSKYFTGTIMNNKELKEWQTRVRDLGEDDGTGLRNDTIVFLAAPKNIQKEVRCWIVNGKVVTSSVYKIGNKVNYQSNLDNDLVAFVESRCGEWNPSRAFVMDIAMTNNWYKIIEINTFNSCGFYAANVGKIIESLERNFG